MPVSPVPYHFETTWQLEAPLHAVWDAIYDTDHWPQWWKGVLSVHRLQEGDAVGLHARNAYVLKSRMPYALRFNLELEEKEPYRLLRCKATGELVGEGIFHISEQAGAVTVQYNWNVYTQKAWMNILAPIARPFFHANHRQVMRWGAEGLARRLNARLLRFTSLP